MVDYMTYTKSYLRMVAVGISIGMLLAWSPSAAAISVGSAQLLPTGGSTNIYQSNYQSEPEADSTGSGGPALSGLTFLPGDANGDGTVDLQDFGILKSNFGTTGATWAQGDFNGDGMVDLQDFGVLKGNFGNNWQESDKSVPEPLTMMGVGLAIAGLGGYLRKRRMA